MTEDDIRFSKDALDLNQNYAENEQPYQSSDKIDDEGIILKRQEDQMEKEKEREKEDFKRDISYYYKIDQKKIDEDMMKNDMERNYEKHNKDRKKSSDIAAETISGNI